MGSHILSASCKLTLLFESSTTLSGLGCFDRAFGGGILNLTHFDQKYEFTFSPWMRVEILPFVDALELAQEF